MLSSTFTRYHWRVDERPGPDIPSRDCVRRSSETALDTEEIVPRLSVGFVDMPALGAFPRCIAWIDEKQGDSGKSGFVGKERPQLMESPVRQSCSLVPSGRYPLSDTAEVFDRDRRFGAFGICYDCLRDAVVHVFLKSCLLSGNLLEFTLRRARLFLLKVAPSMFELAAVRVDRFAAVGFPPGVCGNINNAKVHSKDIRGFYQLGIVYIAHNRKEKFTVDSHQIDFAFAEREPFPLPLAHGERNLLSSGKGPDRNDLVFGESDNIAVVGLCGILSESPLNFPIQFIRVRDLGNRTDDHLGGERESSSRVVIRKFMEMVLPEDLCFPSARREIVTGGIRHLKRCLKDGGLLLRRFQFQVHNQLHNTSIGEFHVLVNN